MKLIKVQLNEDVLASVRHLLATNDLPLEEIDELIESQKSKATAGSDRPIDWINAAYYSATGKKNPFSSIWDEVDHLKPAVTLQ